MSAVNKALVRRTIDDVWNNGNTAAVDQLVASDYMGHSRIGETRGPAGYGQFFNTLRAAFPDLHFEIEDEIAEEDKVVTRWTSRATHQGEFQGIPPTGKQGQVDGISIFRVASNKIVECWTNTDELGLLQQLGVIPSPGQSGR